MIKTVVVVTTKPELNEAEYGVRDDQGNWLIHGVQIAVDFGALSDADKSALAVARSVLLRLAQEDASTKGLV